MVIFTYFPGSPHEHNHAHMDLQDPRHMCSTSDMYVYMYHSNVGEFSQALHRSLTPAFLKRGSHSHELNQGHLYTVKYTSDKNVYTAVGIRNAFIL